MERSSGEGRGSNILPIPPPLEFPFPPKSAKSSSAGLNRSSLAHGLPSIANNLPVQINGSTTPAALDTVTASQPRPPSLRKNSVTERPRAAPAGSLLGTKRSQPGVYRTALNHAGARQPEYGSSDSSSSSEDEDLAKIRSYNSLHSGGSKGMISKDGPRSHRRRESGGQYSRFSVGNEDYNTRGKVSKRDGRLNISVNQTANRGYLAKALGAILQNQMGPGKENYREDQPLSPLHEEGGCKRPDTTTKLSAFSTVASLEVAPIPRMNIVIMVIGSRGDIQPFLKIGKVLKEQHGHRVRIATHPAFKTFVQQDVGLEFFSVGGDPSELMAFMVKNPGLIPSVSTVRTGEVGRRRDAMAEMFHGFWRACINVTDNERDRSNIEMMGKNQPFVADAIIANPPCFAHIHCAERLGIPLHLMFTFPYSPTQQFPHPLANIKRSNNVDTNYVNFMSYPLVEMVTWQGLGDLVNNFRVKTLGLEPVSTLWAPGQLFRLKVPYTYLWSPDLIPKPADWGPEIDIAGFVFLDLASSFKPPECLIKFLDAGEPPVYIGFGSIVVDDPDKFTSLIFEAVKKAGVRALVSKGWGGLGDEGETPDNIYMLENTPHDWLFHHVSAVVHHGGAGTTAIGLKCGKPTMIVPFFGDQPFWGTMVAAAGAGAHRAIPYKYLTVDALAEGIMQCLTPETKLHAEELARNIAKEGDGAENAVKSFHDHLPLRGPDSMRCSVLPENVAVWALKSPNLKLSAAVAELLIQKRNIKWSDLRLARHCDWHDFEGPGEPLSGAGAAMVSSAAGVAKGVGGLPVKWAKSLRQREKDAKRKKQRTTSKAQAKSGHRSRSPKPKGLEKTNGHVKTPVEGENTSILSRGGQHGTERNHPESEDHGIGKDLPGSEDLASQNRCDLERPGNVLNGSAMQPSSLESVDQDTEDTVSLASHKSQQNIVQDLVEDTGHGLAKSGQALAKAPMDLALAIAQGFHNAPRLYGDATVRRPIRISGYRSGLRAAGEEFTFGIYDGVTGLFLQPYHGAKDGGALGFAQGVGKGIGGFVLKDLAAVIGPIGYTLKGVHKEITKGKQPTGLVRKGRIVQGGKDVRALDMEARARMTEKVDAAWLLVLDIRNEIKSTKKEGLSGRIALASERRKLRKQGGLESVEKGRRALETWRKERGHQNNGAVGNNGNRDEKVAGHA